jgi:hypothetical protein
VNEFGESGLADSLVARMAAQRDLLREMDDRFSSISANAASPDESVSVEVDALGAMTALSLNPQALELERSVGRRLGGPIRRVVRFDRLTRPDRAPR